ncbi:MAG: type II secretion system protein [Verrucomicrobia bacterium]|nr:type II secretion system protein [Verrucomicrobiota bacterium]
MYCRTSTRNAGANTGGGVKTRMSILVANGRQVRRKVGLGGYTLLELVGVLAIITILGLIVTENVLEKIKQQARKTEGDNLAVAADAMRRSVVRTKSIPGAGNMPAQIAAELSLPISKILTTPFRQTRYFFMHPDFRVGTNLTSSLPYTQTVFGSTIEPANCKALIISSVGPLDEDLLPASMDSTTFTNLWNTSEDWDALARDVKLQRIEFRDLFHRVILNNLDSSRDAPFSVESTNTLTYVVAGGRFETWFIDTTALNLHLASGELQTCEIIREDVSYVFENGRWARYLTGGRGTGSGVFGSLVDAFLNSSLYGGRKFAADQQSIVDEIYNYLWYVALWANDGFPGDDKSNPRPQIPEWRVGYDAADRLADFAKNLVGN